MTQLETAREAVRGFSQVHSTVCDGGVDHFELSTALRRHAEVFAGACASIVRSLKLLEKELTLTPSRFTGDFYTCLKEVRDAFEHSEERMRGLAFGKPLPTATVAFANFHDDFVEMTGADGRRYRLRIAESSIDELIRDARPILEASGIDPATLGFA